MRILLRQKASGLYRGTGGAWVSSLSEAVDFTFIDQALDAAQHELPTETTVIVRSEQPSYEIALSSARLASVRVVPPPEGSRTGRLRRLWGRLIKRT